MGGAPEDSQSPGRETGGSEYWWTGDEGAGSGRGAVASGQRAQGDEEAAALRWLGKRPAKQRCTQAEQHGMWPRTGHLETD